MTTQGAYRYDRCETERRPHPRRGEKARTGSRNTGTLEFTLADPPTSLNPGNLEEFNCELQQEARFYARDQPKSHDRSVYNLDSVSYD